MQNSPKPRHNFKMPEEEIAQVKLLFDLYNSEYYQAMKRVLDYRRECAFKAGSQAFETNDMNKAAISMAEVRLIDALYATFANITARWHDLNPEKS